MWLIRPVRELTNADLPVAGGKAVTLARLSHAGIATPAGVVLSVHAYRQFVEQTGLGSAVHLELARKPLADMRWEELWDAALRIRNRFLKTSLPSDLEAEIREVVEGRFGSRPVVVRSSAPGEDAAGASFAGLHESYVHVIGADSILDHVRLVWASLWSDRALLYRKELGLDPHKSAMAVLVQEIVVGDRSGVSFTADPTGGPGMVVEGVWGLNQGLVDGSVAPDRWTLESETGRVAKHVPSERSIEFRPAQAGVEATPLPSDRANRAPLEASDLERLANVARSIVPVIGGEADIEWTFAGDELIVLQARPITTGQRGGDQDNRPWYLSLTRSLESLRELRDRVEHGVEEMNEEASILDDVDLGGMDGASLAREIHRRIEIRDRWVAFYWEYCIPFAHGIRLFGQVYNDIVRPDDPFEFMSLLAGHELEAKARNDLLNAMAETLRQDPDLSRRLAAGESPGGSRIARDIEQFLDRYGLGSIASGDHQADARGLIRLLLEMADRPIIQKPPVGTADEETFLSSLPPERRASVAELLELARASYRLRDDDNLALARIEKQLGKAVQRGRALVATEAISNKDAEQLVRVLEDPSLSKKSEGGYTELPEGVFLSARQLVGQPAGPGIASGSARVVTEADDLFGFRSGEILVCDAVSPTMTLVAPLAGAIVERRGGMLIHGAIIAREYGVPCVTGVPDVLRWIRTGDLLTVDGFLGIVTRSDGSIETDDRPVDAK